jgi:hypothetical protein
MNSTHPETTGERPVWHVGLGFLVASLLFAALVLWLKCATPVPAIDADRAAERAKDLADIRAAEARRWTTPAGLTSHVAWCGCRLPSPCSWPPRRGRIPPRRART